VKSEGNLEDILAADTPALWKSNRPAKGGATGEMLAEIIEKAAAIKAGRPVPKAASAAKGPGTSKARAARSRSKSK